MSISSVCVLYPRGVRTGGPEALHQLVDAMRSLGLPAGLVPYRATAGRPRVAAYERYDAPELSGIQDIPGEVVIAPDIFVRDVLDLQHSRRFCWWLSIDNSPLFRAERRLADRWRGLGEPFALRDLKSLLLLARRETTRWRTQLRGIEHLAQSAYAKTYLSDRLGIAAAPLSDYVPTLGSSSADHRTFAMGVSGPRIAYNPAKGSRLVRRVQDSLERPVTWDPIAGLSPAEVLQHLADADVYLDLGAQPGKDRMPREAALMGAISIVAERGAGALLQDFPLPAAHKVSVAHDPIGNAVRVLEHVLDDLPGALRQQQDYRDHIRDQERVFRAEVHDLAGRLLSDENEGCVR